jgi:hypothetical protein
MRTRTTAAVRVLLPLLLVGAALLTSSLPSQAVNICGTRVTVNYYANSNDTGLVGTCTLFCAGGESCTGHTSPYSTDTPGFCYAC